MENMIGCGWCSNKPYLITQRVSATKLSAYFGRRIITDGLPLWLSSTRNSVGRALLKYPGFLQTSCDLSAAKFGTFEWTADPWEGLMRPERQTKHWWVKSLWFKNMVWTVFTQEIKASGELKWPWFGEEKTSWGQSRQPWPYSGNTCRNVYIPKLIEMEMTPNPKIIQDRSRSSEVYE